MCATRLAVEGAFHPESILTERAYRPAAQLSNNPKPDRSAPMTIAQEALQRTIEHRRSSSTRCCP